MCNLQYKGNVRFAEEKWLQSCDFMSAIFVRKEFYCLAPLRRPFFNTLKNPIKKLENTIMKRMRIFASSFSSISSMFV